MIEIVWLEDARNDLESIYQFVAQQNQRSAAKIHNQIYDTVGILKTSPMAGMVDTRLNDGDSAVYRSLIVRRRYKVVHKIVNNKVYILVVWDCRRDPEKLKEAITNKP